MEKQGWWLLSNKVVLTTAAVIANCIVFLIGYRVLRGAKKQKHVFKKNPKAPIWGVPPKVIGGKLLASVYWPLMKELDEMEKINAKLSAAVEEVTLEHCKKNEWTRSIRVKLSVPLLLGTGLSIVSVDASISKSPVI
ncbi:unnamed protein product [Camellia sinensis]